MLMSVRAGIGKIEVWFFAVVSKPFKQWSVPPIKRQLSIVDVGRVPFNPVLVLAIQDRVPRWKQEIEPKLALPCGSLRLVIVTSRLETEGWILGSLVFPLYYLAASWAVTLAEWRRGRGTVGE